MVETIGGLGLCDPWRSVSHDFSIDQTKLKRVAASYNHFITFHGFTTIDQDNELKEWLKINTTKDYFLCRDRVYFREEADMGWFLLRFPPN